MARRDRQAIPRDCLNRAILDVWDEVSGMPLVRPIVGLDPPDQMVAFHNRSETPDADCWHFYSEDYKIERVWSRPERYARLLADSGRVITGPDFSMFMDDPPPVQRWNVYRSRLLTALWQREGVRVVPTVQWADERSWSFAFDGLPVGSMLAVSFLGSATDGYLRRTFIDGYAEMVVRLAPSFVMLYTMADPPSWVVSLAPCRVYLPPNLERRRRRGADPAQLLIPGG